VTHEVWVTGIGLLSSLGEGTEAHWAALTDANGPTPVLDAQTWPPMVFHPLGPVDYDRQIPKKGDQRQMEPWQRIGVYAAGLALSAAGVAGNAELLARTHMVVAAGGGERDVTVDMALIRELSGKKDVAPVLNARLSGDLRPTLFLAQLTNLLAGSISIVHGVRGSSRSFMGEEMAGADAVRIAHARIAAGQISLGLVGGSFNASRPDMGMLYAAAGTLTRGTWHPVWARAEEPGFAMGSLGAFLVLEEAGHARARGAQGLARLAAVATGLAPSAEAAAADAGTLWDAMQVEGDGTLGVLSGVTGAEPVTTQERRFLARLANERRLAVRATGTILGHGVEAQFPLNVALAALALSQGGFYPPFDAGGEEAPVQEAVRQVLVTGFAQRRGEGLALLEAIA
jgi:3-oxoacyl-[acyl-carrier-protein] synthase II